MEEPLDEIISIDGNIVIGRLDKVGIVTYAASKGQSPSFSKFVICSKADAWETKDLLDLAHTLKATNEFDLQLRASKTFAEMIAREQIKQCSQRLNFDPSERLFALIPNSPLKRWFAKMISDVETVGTFKLVGSALKLKVQLNVPYSDILKPCQEARHAKKKKRAA